MAVTCPAIDPTKPLGPPPLPSLDFDLGSIFAPSATLSIPWVEYAQNSKLVPGGNRYYSIIKPANTQDPLIRAAVGLMNAISRQQFWDNFGAGKPYANMLMSDVLARYKGKLATSYGKITVTVMPKPNERAVDFTHRGGYLLWIDPQTGVFTGKRQVRALDPPSWIQSVGVSDVHAFYLFLKYLPDRDVIDFEVKLEYDGTLDKINNVSNAIVKKFCNTVSDGTLAKIAAYKATYPQAAQETAMWSYWGSLCNRAFPPCTPAGGPSTPAGGPTRLTLGPLNVKPKYPTGAIAYYDGAVYRIAVPRGLEGFTATYTEIAREPALPIGVAAVSYWTWQRVTKPLWSRTSFFLGTGTVAAVGAGILFAVTHRRH